jgi:hypothetical protein
MLGFLMAHLDLPDALSCSERDRREHTVYQSGYFPAVAKEKAGRPTVEAEPCNSR